MPAAQELDWLGPPPEGAAELGHSAMDGQLPASPKRQAAPLGSGGLPKRGALLLLGVAMELVCYADRTNISLAILPMSAQHGFSDATQGWVLASFFIGYSGTQIMGGWAAKRFGAKPVLGWAVAGYSLMTVFTPAAAAVSVPVLCACRVLLGLAEGVSLPCVHQLTADWIPITERSRFLTACTSGQFVGTLAAMACAPMVDQYWPAIFYLFGGLGLVWVAGWCWLAHSRPEEHPTISAAELAHIQAGKQEQAENGSTGWFVHKAMVAPVVAHWAHNWGWYLLLSWLPKYLRSRYGLSLQQWV